MFLFYVLSIFKKGDNIQGGTLFKGGQYLRKYCKCLPALPITSPTNPYKLAQMDNLTQNLD